MLRASLIALGLAIFMVSSGGVATEQQRPGTFSLARLTPAMSVAGAGSIVDVPWSEHVYSAATGETVDVSVSTSYPAVEDIGQHWTDFYAALPHGPELGRLKVYVAPLVQVQSVCGKGAVGCYGDDQLLHVNEAALGFSPEEVARHEYGHHIALNRLNTPWPSFDWGPKRWATAAGICARVRSGSAYPGDESLLYMLNPGEAFAEAYRVLVDTGLGQTGPPWPLVDRSFYPGQSELDAVEQDVAAPWTGPTRTILRPRLNRQSIWERRVPTPLDGTVTLRVGAPSGTDVRVALLAGNGRKVLAVRRSSRGGPLAIKAEVCGERSVTALVRVANSAGRRIEVRLAFP